MNHPLFATIPLALATGIASADGTGITSAQDEKITAQFDILSAEAHREGRIVTFRLTTAGEAGSEKPQPAGTLAGAPVTAYVWPTSLDPATVGFEGGTGILALSATVHPDFDDTPLNDETGDADNDGDAWHSHWVVLTPAEDCGPGALKVRDIPEGETPALPPTWPGLPLFIDSPGYTPMFDGPEIRVRVPLATDTTGASYDGVTAALRVNANIHAPLLCVTDVFDVASGDLSLPGRID